jgi:hypothetical protein
LIPSISTASRPVTNPSAPALVSPARPFGDLLGAADRGGEAASVDRDLDD